MKVGITAFLSRRLVLYVFADVSEEPGTSISREEEEAVGSSETSPDVIQIIRYLIPGDRNLYSHFRENLKYSSTEASDFMKRRLFYEQCNSAQKNYLLLLHEKDEFRSA